MLRPHSKGFVTNSERTPAPYPLRTCRATVGFQVPEWRHRIEEQRVGLPRGGVRYDYRARTNLKVKVLDFVQLGEA